MQLCSAGTFLDKPGQDALDDCELCPGGTYSATEAAPSVCRCLTCPRGNFCPRGTSEPVACASTEACPPGSLRADGTVSHEAQIVAVECEVDGCEAFSVIRVTNSFATERQWRVREIQSHSSGDCTGDALTTIGAFKEYGEKLPYMISSSSDYDHTVEDAFDLAPYNFTYGVQTGPTPAPTPLAYLADGCGSAVTEAECLAGVDGRAEFYGERCEYCCDDVCYANAGATGPFCQTMSELKSSSLWVGYSMNNAGQSTCPSRKSDFQVSGFCRFRTTRTSCMSSWVESSEYAGPCHWCCGSACPGGETNLCQPRKYLYDAQGLLDETKSENGMDFGNCVYEAGVPTPAPTKWEERKGKTDDPDHKNSEFWSECVTCGAQQAFLEVGVCNARSILVHQDPEYSIPSIDVLLSVKADFDRSPVTLPGVRPGRGIENHTLAPEWVEGWRKKIAPKQTCIPLLCGEEGRWRPGPAMTEFHADSACICRQRCFDLLEEGCRSYSFFFEQDANWEPTSGVVDTHGRCYLYVEPVEVTERDVAPKDCGSRKDTFLSGIFQEPGWRYGSVGAVLLGDCRRLPRKESRRCVSLEAPASVVVGDSLDLAVSVALGGPMTASVMRLRVVERGGCGGAFVEAIEGLHCSNFSCYGGPTALGADDFVWSGLRARAVGSYTVCICLAAPCGAAVDYLAAGDLQVLPGAYWETKSSLVVGTPALITVTSPDREGALMRDDRVPVRKTFAVAKSCHGIKRPANTSWVDHLSSVIDDPWAITTEAAFYINCTYAGDAEVCICEEACESISPLIDSPAIGFSTGWHRIIVTEPPKAQFEVVPRAVLMDAVSEIVVNGKHFVGLPSLQVGCGCAIPDITPISANPLTYAIPEHPRVIGKVDLCIGGDYIGPLIISGVNISGVTVEGLLLKVPGSSLDKAKDKAALALFGMPCTQPEAVLSAAASSSTTLLTFTAPTGRYKVCFCDSTSSEDCTNMHNFFEVAADVDFIEVEGLSCLTAQPQLLQPHCVATTDIIPGDPVGTTKRGVTTYAEPPEAKYDYTCSTEPGTPWPTPTPTPKSPAHRRRVSPDPVWTFPFCNTSDARTWPPQYS
jgi:hypothetical protein